MARTSLTLPFSGDRLRSCRERAGLTQQELAERCGLSRFQISRWETGEAKPGARSLRPLVRGLAEVLERPAGSAYPFTLDELLETPVGVRTW
ncbi:helix-turn-helix domain-containing protein [Actinocrispum wychmicini]|uniref:Helix-turn-helix protein n=1 Tax=Actinocrispum wychmicini TaxID=1213861 RepID=A0A4R2JR34_9PSEU|nr:helix-turn-helix protein [Actinocrispum wychmicini]